MSECQSMAKNIYSLSHFLCAGTYPVLGLTSSRLFDWTFDAGLLSSDLHKLSKIKIRSTIFTENVPQLLIDCLSYLIETED